MMMLMDLPRSRSRSPAPLESSGKREITPKHTHMPVMPGVELPQATKRGSSFCQRAEEQPSTNVDDLSSSSVDKGIDHQIIDSLLSRRKTPFETEESVSDLRRVPRIPPPEVDKFMKSSHSSTLNEVNTVGEDAQSARNTTSVTAVTILSRRMEDPEPPEMNVERIIPNEEEAHREKEQSIQHPTLVTAWPSVSNRVEEAEPPTVNVRRNTLKLVNPATRGPSLQSLANKTVDTMAPIITNMAPPPVPRVSDRRGRVNTRVDTEENQSLGGPVTEGGPWSRESFDLFGSWRPQEQRLLPQASA
jgi:hypothetical protein